MRCLIAAGHVGVALTCLLWVPLSMEPAGQTGVALTSRFGNTERSMSAAYSSIYLAYLLNQLIVKDCTRK